MKESESTPSSDKYSSEKMRTIIQDVIDGDFSVFDVETMADYDAQFSTEVPYFMNIWNKQVGYGFGYIVFHDFLRRVGIGNLFFSTAFTDPGEHLFEKAVSDGLIERTSGQGDQLNNYVKITEWKVVGDPVKNLEKLRD